MNSYCVDLQFQDIKGNAQSKRFRSLKAENMHAVIEKAEGRLRKRKNFLKLIGGDITELTNVKVAA